jgi:hypothetical protein
LSSEAQAVETIKELATALKDTLVDLDQYYFLTLEIQNIDNEISASNDYYDQQNKLMAGNDERQNHY